MIRTISNNIYNNEIFYMYTNIVKYLTEDEIYNFQVYAQTMTDYQSSSEIFEILIPPRTRMRAIAFGTTAIILILLTGASIFVYTKKRCFKPYKTSNEHLDRK